MAFDVPFPQTLWRTNPEVREACALRSPERRGKGKARKGSSGRQGSPAVWASEAWAGLVKEPGSSGKQVGAL